MLVARNYTPEKILVSETAQIFSKAYFTLEIQLKKPIFPINSWTRISIYNILHRTNKIIFL